MQGPIITFESRSGWYGVRAAEVLEVAHLGRVRPVPHAPRIVAGLAEIHGRVVTLIDLDRLLEAGSGEGPAAGYGVVLAPPQDHLGILVRSALDVARVGDEEKPEPPESGGLLLGCLPVGDRLLNLLSLPALVSRVEEAIREAFRPGRAGAGGEA